MCPLCAQRAGARRVGREDVGTKDFPLTLGRRRNVVLCCLPHTSRALGVPSSRRIQHETKRANLKAEKGRDRLRSPATRNGVLWLERIDAEIRVFRRRWRGLYPPSPFSVPPLTPRYPSSNGLHENKKNRRCPGFGKMRPEAQDQQRRAPRVRRRGRLQCRRRALRGHNPERLRLVVDLVVSFCFC